MTSSSTLPHDDPKSAGFSAERLARIEPFVQQNYLDTGKLPNFSFVVARKGSIGCHFALGFQDIDAQTPMTLDSLVRIYSMSKPVTSVALMQLVERAEIQLSDPVARYIPSWKRQQVWDGGNPRNYRTTPPNRPVTVQDLLRHTAGLTYSWMGDHPVDAIYRSRGVERGSGQTLQDMCEQLADVPLLFQPGTRWAYSVATDVAGHLVELVSGQPLDEYFANHIFDPLGMADTGFFVDDANAHRLASNYAHPQLSPFGVPADVDQASMCAKIEGNDRTASARNKPVFLSGGGGLISTLGDYYRFASMLGNGGTLDDAQLLSPATVAYMTRNHLPNLGDLASMGQPVFSETNYEGVGFGLGFSVMLEPALSGAMTSPGEFAWGGAASTLFWVDPVEEIVAVGLTQLMPSSAYPIRQQLRALVYGAIAKRQ